MRCSVSIMMNHIELTSAPGYAAPSESMRTALVTMSGAGGSSGLNWTSCPSTSSSTDGGSRNTLVLNSGFQ